MSRFRRILHPTDFSRASGAAFQWAMGMAKTNHAELVLIHVMSPAALYYVSPQTYAGIEAAARAAGQKLLNALAGKAKKAGVRCKTLLLDGIPHERIVRAARSTRADLVVIGTHGRSGFAKVMLGSVASRVVASATCPVLTVRGK
jgi:nucleotide-binding universal stress UspA family protein